MYMYAYINKKGKKRAGIWFYPRTDSDVSSVNQAAPLREWLLNFRVPHILGRPCEAECWALPTASLIQEIVGWGPENLCF